MLKRFAIACLILCSTGSIYATNGIYVDALMGWAKQTGLPSASDVSATKIKNSEFPVWQGEVGYNHDINPNVGIGMELGAGLFTKTTYSFSSGAQTKVNESTMNFLAQTTFHLVGWDLIAKGGAAYRTTNVAGEHKGQGNAQVKPLLAVAADYPFMTHFAAYATYEHFFGNNNSTFPIKKAPRMNAVLGGLRVIF